jgi:hypothetical protein
MTCTGRLGPADLVSCFFGFFALLDDSERELPLFVLHRLFANNLTVSRRTTRFMPFSKSYVISQST